MKACLLIAHSFSTPHSFTLSLARIFKKNSYEVIIFGVGGGKLPKHETLEEGIFISRIRNDGIFFTPFISLLNPLTILSLIKNALLEKADIYWCHGYAMTPIVIVLKMLGKKVLYDVGDDDPSNFSNVISTYFNKYLAEALENGFRRFEGTAISLADYTITLTESLRLERKKYSDRIKTIYYCVDSVFCKHNIDNKIIDKFSGYEIIVYSGTISEMKGFNEIIEAFRIVKRQIPNALLIVVGGPPSNLKISSPILKDYEDSDVIITGWKSYTEMPKYINLGKIGLAIVKPANHSYVISVPFKLLEQMACGLPVIAPKGLPEVERIVNSSKSGVLVNAEDPTDIANSILCLLKDKERRMTMGERAANYIDSNHRMESYQKEFLKICRYVDIDNEWDSS